ncbi:MAG: YtxH domain-containing protein [Thermoflavifilum aggregans]|nr:YtxH domain-containing protein [Thermoflavifilum aggregans]
MDKKNAYLVGLIAAAAAGLVAGLLLAPKKGAELRKDIKEKADEFSEQLKRVVKKGKEKAQEAEDEFQHAIG